MENSKFLTIRPNEFNFDREGYNFTKVLGLKCYCGNKLKITRKQPTTWASLAREVINSFSYEIDKAVEYNWEAFEIRFNKALKDMIQSWGGKTNTSFSEELFVEPTHIRSNVYRNNQNSMLEIFRTPMGEPRYITAVYSGEVVWVLNALITALEDFDSWIEIEYISRNDLNNIVSELDEEDRQLSLDDIPRNNEDALETDETEEEVIGLEGSAEIYINLLSVALNDAERKYGISEEDYKDMSNYIKHIELALSDIKAYSNVIADTLLKLKDRID